MQNDSFWFKKNSFQHRIYKKTDLFFCIPFRKNYFSASNAEKWIFHICVCWKIENMTRFSVWLVCTIDCFQALLKISVLAFGSGTKISLVFENNLSCRKVMQKNTNPENSYNNILNKDKEKSVVNEFFYVLTFFTLFFLK
jgi:hypothetical protein